MTSGVSAKGARPLHPSAKGTSIPSSTGFAEVIVRSAFLLTLALLSRMAASEMVPSTGTTVNDGRGRLRAKAYAYKRFQGKAFAVNHRRGTRIAESSGIAQILTQLSVHAIISIDVKTVVLMVLPAFTVGGILPPGDYEMNFDELRESHLVTGQDVVSVNWDQKWRAHLVDNLEILVKQLWRVGVSAIFINGSFVEDKDHPNDIDGYFECDLRYFASGQLDRDLNAADPFKAWTWDRTSRNWIRTLPSVNCQCGISIEWSFILISQAC